MNSSPVEVSDECIRLAGELTMHCAEGLKRDLLAALPATARCARLDLSQVTEIDTAGLQLLIAAQQEARARGGSLQVIAVSGTVLEVLELFRQQHLMSAPPVEARP
jgi:anti-sigma B factor antagonist